MGIQVGEARVLNNGAALAGDLQRTETTPARDFTSKFLFGVGERVLVEVTGTVKVRQETEFGLKYIVEPDNPKATAVHASPEYVFPLDEDDGEPTEAATEADLEDKAAP